MPKNVVIIPASGWTYFNNSSSQTIGQLIVDPITEEFLISGNTLNLEGSTSVNVGNGYGNIYIGNGITPTNIIFDQSGEIKGDGSPLQLTFGSATDYIKISTNGQFDLIGITSASTTSNVLSYNSSTSRVNYTPLSLLFSSGASIGSFGNVLLNSVSGNTLIGTSINSGYKLDVSGTARVTSGLTVSNSLILDGSDLATAWIPYVPTWESDGVTQPSLGNGLIRAFYKVIGKTVFLRVKLDWGTTTSGGSGVWLFGLPIDALEAYGIQFSCSMLDNGNAWYQGIVNGEYSGLTDKVAIIAQSAGGVNSSQGVTATFPFTWGNLDSLQFSGSYEST